MDSSALEEDVDRHLWLGDPVHPSGNPYEVIAKMIIEQANSSKGPGNKKEELSRFCISEQEAKDDGLLNKGRQPQLPPTPAALPRQRPSRRERPWLVQETWLS